MVRGWFDGVIEGPEEYLEVIMDGLGWCLFMGKYGGLKED